VLQYPLPPGLPDTPARAFAAVCRRPGAFWLDSGDRPAPHARYHFLGCDPIERFEPADGMDPFEATRSRLTTPAADAPELPAVHRLATFAYDVGRFVERIPDPGDRTPEPEALVLTYAACIAYDLETGRAWITAQDRAAADRLERTLGQAPAVVPSGPLTTGPPATEVTAAGYAESVRKVRDYIAAGDVYQVNLSHRFSAQLRPGIDAAALYQRLRARHSACYGAFVDLGDTAIVSNSPEGFLSITEDRIATWPLKGTRPRWADPQELLNDPKERAEHVMIVDLERNDLGRIAVPGTVRVPALLDVVTHPTVHHLESRIEATPRPDADLIDILRATFPGGSITGAPKIRAMEIIAELERERRGIYCGALGVVDHRGRSRWSIPIRTAVVAGDQVTFRVGGGIVADSCPEREYEETLTKARAFLDVLTS